MKRKNIFLLIPIILIVAFLVIIFNYDNVLKWRYKKAVESKDCEKIYDLVDIEGKYLTKEKYVTQCKIKLENYNNYEIEIEDHKIKNNLVKVYDNIKVHIPTNSGFYLDDELITENFVSDEKGIYNVYTFDRLFEGEYNIKFNNQNDEENYVINIHQNNLEELYEYNNKKQLAVVVGYSACPYCNKLLEFLKTIDHNILEVKYYDIYASGYNIVNLEAQRVISEISQKLNVNVNGYPSVVIGNEYKSGYTESLEKEYIDTIYNAYRNEIETIIK